MKIAILVLVILLVVFFFRFVRNVGKNHNLNKKKDNVIDLEKDPETDEYKPKE